MKAYIFDTIERYKRFSISLDVQTFLCNKSWHVFNDTGDKEIYIFENDGTLIISINGKVSMAKWKFISANQSILINSYQDSYLLKAAFVDDKLLVFEIDGTNQFSFMINEQDSYNFVPKTLSDIKSCPLPLFVRFPFLCASPFSDGIKLDS